MASIMQERLARWQERLQNLTVSPLTRDYPEPSHNESEKRPIEAFQSLELSQETQNSLKQLQITDGAKPHSNFAIFLTALVILVGRLTGDENICLGTSGEKGRPFVLRADFDTSESFETLLVKIEKVGQPEVLQEQLLMPSGRSSSSTPQILFL
jgi:L-2-aminoadipate reductase